MLALRSHGESIVCGLRGEADARRKALEHQATHLSASSSQLSAAFELGSSILADASAPAHVLAWCVEDVDRLARLYVPVKSLAVPTGITVRAALSMFCGF